MEQLILYEYPMNETVRLCLRLECLFAQSKNYLDKDDYWDTRATVATIVDIFNILDRPEFKSKLLKEIMQCRDDLKKHIDDDKVDQEKLQHFLEQISNSIDYLQNLTGKLNQELEKDEFLNSIRLRLTKTGGARNFDLPRYHHWLHQAEHKRKANMKTWFNGFSKIQTTVNLFLMLIRGSTQESNIVAEDGYFEKVLDNSIDYRLLRISLRKNIPAFPDISVGRHRMSLHFFTLDKENERPIKYKQDVPFQLTCCA